MTTMTNQSLTFGTRGSALARRQTEMVAQALQAAHPNLTTHTQIFTTKGDRELSKPLPQIGGKGLFTAELEAALREGRIDLAVHSLKDLPIEDAPGLTIGAILAREDPADVLVSRAEYTVESAARSTPPLAQAASAGQHNYWLYGPICVSNLFAATSIPESLKRWRMMAHMTPFCWLPPG